MPYQKNLLSFAKGIDESIGDQMRAPDHLTDVINGRWTKKGTIEKRHGFQVGQSQLSGSSEYIGDATKGQVRGLFSTGRELCAIGSHRLYAYNPTADRWFDRGAVSPFVGKLDPIFYGEESFESCDLAMDEAKNYVLYASQVRRRRVDETGTTVETWNLRCTARDSTGVTTYGSSEPTGGNVLSARPHSVRCCGMTNRIVVGVMRDGEQGATESSTLDLFEYDTTAPNTQVLLSNSSFLTNVYYPVFSLSDSWNNIRSYDFVGLSGGSEWLSVHIDDTSRDIILRAYNTSDALQRSLTYAEDAYRVSACDDPDIDRVYVAVWARSSGEIGAGNELRLYGFVKSTLAYSFGPVVLDTLASGESVGSNLGVVKGFDSSSTGRVMVTWSVHQSSTLGNINSMRSIALHRRSATTSGGSLSNLKTLHNVYPVSRPWYKNGRFYVAASSHSGKHPLFGYSVVYDLREDEDDSGFTKNDPKIAGIYDLGVAPSVGQVAYSGQWSGPGMKGSANNVVIDNSGVVRFMSQSQAATEQSVSLLPRIAADEVQLDYTGPVTAAATVDGAAVISGGYCSYYDGLDCVEVGFPVPPLIVEHDSVNDGSGTGPTGTDHYGLACFYYFDHAGLLHRSMPSPAEHLSGHTSGHGIEYRAMSYPGTHRFNGVNSVFFHSSSSDTSFRRVQPPAYFAANNGDVALTARYLDIEDDPGEFLYIQGGVELENVSPEGAAIVANAIDRIWLGKHWRRERVSFSKPYAPGSATERATAVEFHDDLTKLLPSGEEPTGIVELSDRVIIFTANSIYWLAGDGPDNGGRGSDYPPLTLITSETGCIEPRSVVRMGNSGVAFQGARGIYMLTSGDSVEFIGYPVVDQLASTPTIVAASLNAKTSEVYFACAEGQILVFNYLVNAWSRWIPLNWDSGAPITIRGACMHQGDYYICGTGGDSGSELYKLDTTSYRDTSTYVTTTVETGWIQNGQPAGWQRLRKFIPVLQRKSTHELTIELFKDFEAAAYRTVVFDTAAVAAFPNGNAFYPSVHNSIQKASAYKIRISDTAGLAGQDQGFTASGVLLEWLPRRGTVKTGHAQKA